MAKVKHICNFRENELFEIPPYQRLYEWKKEQIETLLDDMKKACDESKENYFIGNITTSIKTNKDGQDNKNDETNKIYVLIDGQQRLTTLWFIGFYLANRECECNNDKQKVWQNFILKGDKLRIDMPIRDNEQNSLTNLAKKIVDGKHKFEQDKDGKVNLFKELQNIHQKIVEAFSCIELWFKNIEKIKENEIKDFAQYIYAKVCFVFVTLAENTDLNRFFVRMNNRGKQLEKHEILKARLLNAIRESYKNEPNKKDEWQKYAKIWDLCSDMDKYIFQSASDRQVLEKDNKDDDKPNRIESMIDFSTFLLHCYKLHSNNDEISIFKDNLLENVKLDSLDCENFIKDILYYRVLFDYFVIKNDIGVKQGNIFKIRRLQSYKNKNGKKYYRLPDDGESATDNSSLKTLATIQNYLRVARRGANQNYHHWLTPFLKFLSEKVNIDGKIIAWGNFDNFNKIAEYFDGKNNDNQSNGFDDVVKFLENLDTKLATHQLGENNEKSLLDATNSVLKDLKTDLDKDEQKSVKDFSDLEKWDFLNQDTKTPHYWFYRLEYYLWKKRGESMFVKVESNKRTFKDIAGRFYFRNLNSIEHIQPQSKAEENDWKIYDKGTKKQRRDIDCFGNLALVSVGFNSALKNQDNIDKRLELQKKINKDEVESLKLWLVYESYPNDENWTFVNAQAHQKQMIDILIKSLNSKENK